MTLLRALLFNLLFYLWTIVLGIVGLPLLLAPRHTAMRFGSFWSASVLKLLEWTVGLTWRVTGRENMPAGPAIVAMKHQSAWDTLALPVFLADPAVVLKKELLLVPIYGWYARKAGSIGIDRKAGASALRGMLAEARAAAEAGRPIVIFPEGTRAPVGSRLPYQPGVAALYGQLKLPLVPVAVNSGVFWGRRAFLKRPGQITIEILPAIAAGLDKRRVLQELETRIETATAALVAAADGTGLGASSRQQWAGGRQ